MKIKSLITALLISIICGLTPSTASALTSDMEAAHVILKTFGFETALGKEALRKIGNSPTQISEYFNGKAQEICNQFASYGMDIVSMADEMQMFESFDAWNDRLFFSRECKLIIPDPDYISDLINADQESLMVQKQLELVFSVINMCSATSAFEFPPVAPPYADEDFNNALKRLFNANHEIERAKQNIRIIAQAAFMGNSDMVADLDEFYDKYYFNYASKVYPMLFSTSEINELADLYETAAGQLLSKVKENQLMALFDFNLSKDDEMLMLNYSRLDTPLMRRYQAYYPFIVSKIGYMTAGAINKITSKYI